MEKKICQSCGMPMTATEHFGTQSNGSPSPDTVPQEELITEIYIPVRRF